MGYTPYKMVGHTLKGIKQKPAAVKLKAFGTKDSDMPDGVSQKSGLLYKGGVGSSPAKGWFSKIGKAAKGLVKKVGGAVGGALGLAKKGEGGGGGKIKAMDDRISALEEGTGGGGQPGTAMEAMSADKDTSKTVPPPPGGGGSKIDMIKKAQGDAAGGAEAGVGATPLEGGMPYKKKK